MRHTRASLQRWPTHQQALIQALQRRNAQRSVPVTTQPLNQLTRSQLQPQHQLQPPPRLPLMRLAGQALRTGAAAPIARRSRPSAQSRTLWQAYTHTSFGVRPQRDAGNRAAHTRAVRVPHRCCSRDTPSPAGLDTLLPRLVTRRHPLGQSSAPQLRPHRWRWEAPSSRPAGVEAGQTAPSSTAPQWRQPEHRAAVSSVALPQVSDAELGTCDTATTVWGSTAQHSGTHRVWNGHHHVSVV